MAASQFETDFTTTARGALLTHFGKTVTYTPRGGTGVSVSAIFREQYVIGEDSRAHFLISKGEVAAPARNDTIDYNEHASDARTWVVEEYSETATGFWRVICRSPETKA